MKRKANVLAVGLASAALLLASMIGSGCSSSTEKVPPPSAEERGKGLYPSDTLYPSETLYPSDETQRGNDLCPSDDLHPSEDLYPGGGKKPK
ncbi:MAG: hypothetical protein SWH78_16575 [Thermodesulfobacteriota bacterium]|nr:hypothetical protein [Thermodesulfobacteriota bacterium]